MFVHRKDVDVDIEFSAWKLWSLPAAFEHLKLFVTERAGLAGKCALLEVSCPALLVRQSVIDAAVPTLVQILRNAIEHGVETPVARLVAGKPIVAIVKLDVTLESGRISVRIQDDGAGIDREAVLGLERKLAYAAVDGRIGAELTTSRSVFARLGIVAPDGAARNGSGLQRAVARIAPMSGELSFTSEPGKGSVVSLSMDKGAVIDDSDPFDLDGLSRSTANLAGGPEV